jgi:hypothetical protein
MQHLEQAAPVSLKAVAARMKKEALQRFSAARENQH